VAAGSDATASVTPAYLRNERRFHCTSSIGEAGGFGGVGVFDGRDIERCLRAERVPRPQSTSRTAESTLLG
jgi:hypothetical protein